MEKFVVKTGWVAREGRVTPSESAHPPERPLSVTVNVDLRPEEFVYASRRHILRGQAMKKVAGLIVALTVLFAVFGKMLFEFSPLVTTALLTAFGLVLVFYGVALLSAPKRIIEKVPREKLVSTIEATFDELSVRGDDAASRMKWSALERADEFDTCFCLVHHGNAIRIIPKRCFAHPDDIEALRAILRANLGDKAQLKT